MATVRNEIDIEIVRDEARELVRAHSLQRPFSANAFLDQHPRFSQFSTIVVDLAYEEYCRRIQQGEHVDPAVFAQQFPSVSDAIHRQLLIHLALVDHVEPGPQHVAKWPTVPSSLLHFDLAAVLGEGGSARVYLAADRNLEMRARVLKVSNSGRREIRSLSTFSHAAIVDVLSIEIDPTDGFDVLCLPLQGRWSLLHVMAILRSHPKIRRSCELWALLAERDETPDWARMDQGYANLISDQRPIGELFFGWACEILSGLAHAHRRGFLHCDVKPSNVLITWTGKAVLLDFDASRPLDELPLSCGGTLAYMAPEQLRLLSSTAEQPMPRLSPATDLYSWAITFYELLTGHSPFTETAVPGSLQEAVQFQTRLRSEAKLEWQRVKRSSPSLLCRVLRQCSQPDVPDRLQSADSALKLLQRHNLPLPRYLRWAYHHPLRTSLFVFFVAAVVLLTGMVLRASPEADTRAGNQALARKDPAMAQFYFKRALSSQPNLLAAREGLVRSLLAQSMHVAAVEHLDHLPPSDWVTRCRAFVKLSLRSDIEAAVELLKPLMEQGRGTAADYNNAACGIIFTLPTENLYLADKWLVEAKRLNPNQDVSLSNRLVAQHRLYARTRQFNPSLLEEALATAPRSLAVQSELAMFFAIRGKIAENEHDHSLAQEMFQAATDAVESAGNLGISSTRLHNIDGVWPKLSDLCQRIRSRRNRRQVEYDRLLNPVLEE